MGDSGGFSRDFEGCKRLSGDRCSQAEMAQWYFGENGRQSGPVEDAEFSALIAAQRITPATLVWRDGMREWVPLSQVMAAGGMPGQPLPMMVGMMNPTTSGLAIASLVFGVAGLVSCFFVLGIPAVVCGHMALNQIANSPVPMVGRGLAIAGLVCGYLTTLITVVFFGSLVFSFASQF